MKKILSIGLIAVIVACSGVEEPLVQDQECFSSGDRTIKWTMVTTWPKNFPGLGMGPENFAKYVDEMTCGRMKIKVYGAGEFVPALGVLTLYHKAMSNLDMALLIIGLEKLSLHSFLPLSLLVSQHRK
jgi:TRAP-type mannitol/chloroaromatic compound transport system substrate-binding protein